MANIFEQLDESKTETNVFAELDEEPRQTQPTPIPSLLGLPPEVRAFAGSTLEGIPIIGPTLLKLGEQIRVLAKDRPIEEIQAETQKLFEENPDIRTAGNFAGAVLGTAPLGVGSVGTALFSTLPRAAATGATIAGADVAARGAEPEDIATGAFFGAAGGAAGVGLSKLIGSGVTTLIRRIRGPKGPLTDFILETSETLKAASRKFYKDADAVGVKLTISTFDDIRSKIIVAGQPTGDLGELAEQVLLKRTPNAAAVMKWLDILEAQQPTLSELDQIRQVLGDVAGSLDPAERRLGKLMVDALDDALDDLTNANFVTTEFKRGVGILKQARGLWRRGKILENIADAAEKATLARQDTGPAIQQRLRTMLGNRKFKRSLSEVEKDILTQVVNSPADKVLEFLSQLRTQIGIVSLGGGFGAATGSFEAAGASVAAGTALGFGARGLKNVLAQRRLKIAVEKIGPRRRLSVRGRLRIAPAKPAAGVAGVVGGVTLERELVDVEE